MFDVYCYHLLTDLSDREIARETVYAPEISSGVCERFNEQYEIVEI